MPGHTKFDYGIRSTISQCLALVGVSFVQICIGIQLSSPSIVIGALMSYTKNEKEWLTMSNADASWFGSLLVLCTPLGCVLSIPLHNRLGHKNCMVLSNVPFIVSHLMMVYAHDINTLYASSVLMGLSIGFASGPFTAYIGEVCEPKLRGALMSCTYIFYYLGGALITTTATITNEWRLAVMINLLIPVLAILILLANPDSPMWLLTKGKTEKAKRTLRKLRGSVSYEMCSSEFREMVIYTRNGQNIENDMDNNVGGDDESPWRQLLRPEVYRPFRLLIVYFFFMVLMSGTMLLPYMYNILTIFESHISIHWATKIVSFSSLFAGILTVFSVNKLGKRFITLLNLSISAFCYISIGLIGRYRESPNQTTSWLMQILYITIVFVSAFGMMPISWALITEVFPMKSRNITCSISSALHLLFFFIMIKFFPLLLTVMDLYEICIVFGIVGVFGTYCMTYLFCKIQNKQYTIIQYLRRIQDIKTTQTLIYSENPKNIYTITDTGFKYGIKSTVSQCLAIIGASFIQVCIGIELLCTTIIIGALQSDPRDEKEWLTMSNEEASWFGSLLYLSTPLGSALSSLVLNRLGHKNCMILSNLPFIASHLMMVYADNMGTLYASSVLMGLSIGFASGPFTAYIGEVCEPKLRGALMSVTNIFYFFGATLFTTTAAITKQWRLAVLINLLIPVLTILILLVSPDSPMWLLTKGKTDKAKRTLGKLRGWVTYEKCSCEFQEMVVYTSTNINTNSQTIETGKDDHDGGDDESPWRQLLRPEVYRPFRLIMIYFFYTGLLTGTPFSPYLNSVFLQFGADIDVKWTITLLYISAMFAGILTVFLVNILGKRFLTLLTVFICATCYISIGLIGRYRTSPNQITSWLMLLLYLTSVFVSAFGVLPISWILLTEVFPMKSRNLTCGICATLNYILSFFMTKYYPDLVTVMDFYNIFTVFGVTGLFGFVYFYFYLPETENKTLQEISKFFK
ncbi:Sugar transporter, conserved site,Major facilitator superfamily domain,Major facilitator, sugar [Cinara cedri]|uniref:Sugar transporter, conserved site,Major facilitator superfamily domain,Major facilitator, sugar n=1 Tax=Cinara cedri TaxID=506608 RepID=A0A5E4MLQ1_9HEMI|nr:Sugar transporter, conserved site,Major facilitator superfamily domain,Major facilitator, sugar [Cinara cedri]